MRIAIERHWNRDKLNESIEREKKDIINNMEIKIKVADDIIISIEQIVKHEPKSAGSRTNLKIILSFFIFFVFVSIALVKWMPKCIHWCGVHKHPKTSEPKHSPNKRIIEWWHIERETHTQRKTNVRLNHIHISNKFGSTPYGFVF